MDGCTANTLTEFNLINRI